MAAPRRPRIQAEPGSRKRRGRGEGALGPWRGRHVAGGGPAGEPGVGGLGGGRGPAPRRLAGGSHPYGAKPRSPRCRAGAGRPEPAWSPIPCSGDGSPQVTPRMNCPEPSQK